MILNNEQNESAWNNLQSQYKADREIAKGASIKDVSKNMSFFTPSPLSIFFCPFGQPLPPPSKKDVPYCNDHFLNEYFKSWGRDG